MLSRVAPACLAFFALSAFAGEKVVSRPSKLHLTLNKAIELALAKNFSLEIERINPQIRKERVTQELGIFDPVLDVQAKHSENTIGDVFERGSIPGTPIVPTNPSAEYKELSRFFIGRTTPTTLTDFGHFPTREITQNREASVGISGLTTLGTEYDLRLGVTSVDPLNGVDERYRGSATISLIQPLLRGAGPNATLHQLRIARNNVLVSEWQLRQQIIDVINDTVAAYNDLQFANENLKVARGFRELAVQLVNDNTKRVNIGVMSPLNITTARAEAASREEAVIIAQRQIFDRENFLKQLITNDLESLLDITLEIEPPPTPSFSADVRAGIAEALEIRPDYRQAKIEIENRHITLAYTKNSALPRFDLTGSLNLLGIDNDFSTSLDRVGRRDQTAWSVGAIFSVPLPNRTGRSSVAAAQLSAAQALIELQRLEQQIVVQVDNASGAVITARQRITSTGEARALAKESLDAGEERLRAGTGTTFEVLELQKKLSEAESAELRAHTDFNKAVSEYQRQIGSTLKEYRVMIDKPKR